LVQDFKSRGVPIDGVGLQTHLTARGILLFDAAYQPKPAYEGMKAALQRDGAK
jgi:GH35 family endo-1,4-beta-xylanase